MTDFLHDTDDTGVSQWLRYLIVAIALLTIVGDVLWGGNPLLTAGVWAVGYFWIAPYCVKKATTWNRSKNWAFFIGAMFNLIGLFFYWIYLLIRGKPSGD